MHWHGPRVTPFSRIDLEDQPSFDECLETMEVELEQAVLVIRGKHEGKDVEFQIGSLRTQGTMNGMGLIHRAEYTDLFSDTTRITRLSQDEWRILLDAELLPDENGHVYRLRMTEEQR